MLSQCSEVGQGQPADPQRPVPAADPDERPGGLQGEERLRVMWSVGGFCVIKLQGCGKDLATGCVKQTCISETVSPGPPCGDQLANMRFHSVHFYHF